MSFKISLLKGFQLYMERITEECQKYPLSLNIHIARILKIRLPARLREGKTGKKKDDFETSSLRELCIIARVLLS